MLAMILQTAVLALLAAPALSAAYRDEAPLQKWSPEYFQYRFFPAQSTYKRRMPSYVQVGWKMEGGRNVILQKGRRGLVARCSNCL